MFLNVHPTNTAITTSIINFPHNFPENGTEMIFSFPHFSFHATANLKEIKNFSSFCAFSLHFHIHLQVNLLFLFSAT